MELTPDQRLEMQRAFEAHLESEVRFDAFSRALYSTDASNHRIEPLGIVIPRHPDEINAAVETAQELNVPVLPRGGGTSLAGQAVGPFVILDCSKHLNEILEIDPEPGSAWVQPGVVCSDLNRRAGRHGLMFGPDPASANRATFGGMIGNNATGAHSIRYGMTADHVRELEVVLSDGATARFAQEDPGSFARKCRSQNLLGTIHRAAERIRADHRETVADEWPRTWRRSSGYSLNYLMPFSPGKPSGWYRGHSPYPPHDGYNLAPVLCGSEGTLAITRKALINLVEVPQTSLLVVLTFDSAMAAAEATPEIVDTAPAAVELLPRALLERAREVPTYARKLTFIDEIPEALLVVEYAGDSRAALLEQAGGWMERGRVLESSDAQADLWEVRKAGLGLLMSVPGDVKPITFIEDVAVPVERLSEYVRRVETILSDNGTTAEWYAHASAGCLHLRPLINLKTARGVDQMRSIANAVADLVIGMGGALSGEHGDGWSHSEFNQRLFGPALTQSFHELKRAFDPQHLLNPGKIIPSTRAPEPRLDARLRYGPDYQTIEIDTHFAHRRESSLAGAVEACTGLGVCRKSDGVMCPSYQATRDEADLTRGRANALRSALSGALPKEALTSEGLHQIFDLCLECKGCKAECPTAVDIARVKAEFLAHYQAEHGVPLRSRLFAEIRALSGLARPIAPLLRALASTGVARRLQEKVLGVARQRRMPPFQAVTFESRLHDLDDAEDGPPVVLFLDTYTNYHEPELGLAAVRVLRALGHRVIVETKQACCGRPMISKGLLGRAKNSADKNLEVLGAYAVRGTPIIGLEPSCILTLRDEYLEFFPDDPRAQALADGSYLLEEYLMGADQDGRPRLDGLPLQEAGAGEVLLHVHCHAKSLVGAGPTRDMLQSAGYDVTVLDSGCCGMAGSFGYEVEHYSVSQQIGELVLFPAVRAANGRRVATHGTSCRTQIHDGTGVEAKHPVQLLAEQLA